MLIGLRELKFLSTLYGNKDAGSRGTIAGKYLAVEATYLSMMNLYIPLSVNRWFGLELIAIAIKAMYENGGFSGRCDAFMNEKGKDQIEFDRPNE